MDGVVVAGEFGCQFGLDGLQGVVGVRLGKGEEDAAGARQQFAAALHRLDRVGEGRRLGVVGDRADFRQMFAHALFDRRLEVGVADAVERRCLQRQGTRGQQRVHVRGLLGDGSGRGGGVPGFGRRRGTGGQHGQRERGHGGTVHGMRFLRSGRAR